MADEHHRRRRLREKLLEPLYRLDVEVVGRLVEQQHVGPLQQDLGQFDTHAPATRELPRGPLEVGSLEAQADERALQFGLAALGTRHQQPLVLRGVALHELHVVVALVVGALAHLALKLFDALPEPGNARKSLLGLLAHGGVVLQSHDLGQVANGRVGRHADVARRGLLLSAQYLQQGRLARPVLAHECYAVAGIDYETGVLEQGFDAELHL